VTTSIVIPAHNEAEHLAAFVRAFLDRVGDERARVGEILIVENGSTDDTYAVAELLAEELPGLARALRVEEASYGAALKRGIADATCDLVAILECDAMDETFLARAWVLADQGADVVVGSKLHPESVDRRPLQRRVLTRLFNRVLRAATGFRGTDTHGLKLMGRDVARKLVAECVTEGEVLQSELVLLADRLGYRVVEAPVRLSETRATPVAIGRRVPKVCRLVGELRRSLARFPRR
jgi:glycosyltransferase involved in cell wall biosynthesis